MWPFKRKQAEPVAYDAMVIDALEAQASGAYIRKEIVGYVAASASAWAETLAIVEVQGSEAVRRALSPLILAQIGRDSIISGGAFYRMQVAGGMVELVRPLYVYRLARGGGWQAQIGEPSSSRLVTLSDAEVLFCPWSTDAGNPHRPVAPWSTITGKYSVEQDAALYDEMKGPLGTVLFAQPGAYADQRTATKVREAMQRNLQFTGYNRGRLAILSNMNPSGGKAFSADAMGKPFRIGGSPPQAVALLREQLAGELLASCSIPPAMLLAGASGPSMITAMHHFQKVVVPGRLAIISQHLSTAFGEDVMLKYPAKYRANNATAARTVSALEKAGVPLAECMELAGLR